MAGGPLEFRVDSKDLAALFAAAKAAEGNIQVELRRGVKKAAQPVVESVKAEAGFSSRIPGSIKVKASFARKGAAVIVFANKKVAPEAAVLEHHGRGGMFRHPVFGDRDVWVSQPAHPFFFNGVQAGRPASDAAMLHLMDDIARKLGFH